MNIRNRFARSQGISNEIPNKQLASEIVASSDEASIREILQILHESKKVDELSDGLKVLEMVGEQNPGLLADAFTPVFTLLQHTQNKIQWRAMSALSTFSFLHPATTFDNLGVILDLMDQGSVITRDHGVKILIGLYKEDAYRRDIGPLLLEQVIAAPDNQLGQYAEKWMQVITQEDRAKLIRVLEMRQPELVNPSHQKRISRVLLKLHRSQKNFEP
ncbi:hypothetical protein [Marinoscillum luteum]|uniref:HEAT repeat domain-containing protein n=1 Tax=Marinoscillum luteum TaxID=861051 RepID=A0ABW7NBX6_9BACT